MSLRVWVTAHAMSCFITGLSIAGIALVTMSSSLTAAQQARQSVQASQTGNAGLVARGSYIVEGVAMCGNCHTPRQPDGDLDRSRWLAGAPVPYLPARPTPDWPIVAPRLAGLPPTNDAGMITLLTTGIWITGKPLRDPMPHFHMTRADAEAVLTYLKSLSPSQ
jgi:mono/diheme cytochrome c family protein